MNAAHWNPFLRGGEDGILLSLLAPLLVALLLPAGLTAQVGAFGGAPPTLAAGEEAAHWSVPILTESAVMVPAGALGGSLVVGHTTGSFMSTGVTFDYEVTQSALSIHYAPSDRFIVGAALQPWSQFEISQGDLSVSESGQGDASIFAKARLFESPDGRTAVAGYGALGLPVGSDGFGAEGVVIGLGGAVSRQLQGASIHGSLGLTLPTDDLDGESVVQFSGGAMYGVGQRVSIGGDLIARLSDGENVVDLAPGVRFRLGNRALLDAAVLVNLSTSLPEIYDAGAIIGLRIGG
jgi:hypothetical protein